MLWLNVFLTLVYSLYWKLEVELFLVPHVALLLDNELKGICFVVAMKHGLDYFPM